MSTPIAKATPAQPIRLHRVAISGHSHRVELFLSLHAAGMTFVVVTHDPNIARYAQRVVTFKDGNVVSDERNR